METKFHSRIACDPFARESCSHCPSLHTASTRSHALPDSIARHRLADARIPLPHAPALRRPHPPPPRSFHLFLLHSRNDPRREYRRIDRQGRAGFGDPVGARSRFSRRRTRALCVPERTHWRSRSRVRLGGRSSPARSDIHPAVRSPPRLFLRRPPIRIDPASRSRTISRDGRSAQAADREGVLARCVQADRGQGRLCTREDEGRRARTGARVGRQRRSRVEPDPARTVRQGPHSKRPGVMPPVRPT